MEKTRESQAVQSPPDEPTASARRNERNAFGRKESDLRESGATSLVSWRARKEGCMASISARTSRHLHAVPRPRTFHVQRENGLIMGIASLQAQREENTHHRLDWNNKWA